MSKTAGPIDSLSLMVRGYIKGHGAVHVPGRTEADDLAGLVRVLRNGKTPLINACADLIEHLAGRISQAEARGYEAGERNMRERADQRVRQVGEAFHTAFRKASSSADADTIWRCIQNMPDEEWSRVVDFVIDGLDVGALPITPEKERAHG